MRRVPEQEARKTKITANQIARGVGQYVGLMYSVEAIDRCMNYLRIERERLLSILTEPLKVPEGKKNEEDS